MMNNLNGIDVKLHGMTLGGKAKEFEWKYDGEKINNSRKVGKFNSSSAFKNGINI